MCFVNLILTFLFEKLRTHAKIETVVTSVANVRSLGVALYPNNK